MQQIDLLINTLKKLIKSKGLTYKQLAMSLAVTEPTLKRAFALKSFTLERIVQICEVIDIDLYQLSRIALTQEKALPDQLTLEQEQLLAQNANLLISFYLLLNGWQADDIAKEYDLSLVELTKRLVQLDKLKLIELLPKNKVKLLISRNIKWRINGPVRRKFSEQMKREFMAGSFDEEVSKLYLETGKLTKHSIAILNKKIERLIKDYNELVELDMNVSNKEKQSYALMVAARIWIFSLFKTEPFKE